MALAQMQRLVGVVKQLRDPDHGCPWDKEQTHQSLLKFLLEESYEFIQATEDQQIGQMEEELGDVLLQILLHCAIGEEQKEFSLESVAKVLADKLIRRHPHVFKEDMRGITSEQVVQNWGEIKKQEHQAQNASAIDPKELRFPALSAAYKIGKRTHAIKFDWASAQEVEAVVASEWQEFKAALQENNKAHLTEEMGDLLFSLAQLARHLKIDPEEALRLANQKFMRRFQKMEQLIQQDQQSLSAMNQAQMDVYWNKVKEQERKERK
ncbi:MAG: nucleoside triphosphate pyrophosphohydrolase [Bacteriovoracaceae bacterium]|nr:nucleoside triphosphate pyrophosphohydrolase [Bacteriovoracaceae bacterium]